MARIRLVTLLLTVVVFVAPPVGASASAPTASSHLASTWDAPNSRARVYDRGAVSVTVEPATVHLPSENLDCELYSTTFAIRWQAEEGHRLTAVVTHDDGYGYTWMALDATTWTMSPDGAVASSQAPVVQQWYRRGTRHSDPRVCPRDTATTNHVEIYTDGPPRHERQRSIVKPQSKNHLALVWEYPHSVRTIAPTRAALNLSTYVETEQPEGACEARLTEIDLTFRAVGSARIIAVGERQPGEPIQYQNGNSD